MRAAAAGAMIRQTVNLPRRKRPTTDRLTVGLAVGAIATAGTVLGGQFARMVRRRVEAEADGAASVLESAEHALGAATQATQDTARASCSTSSAAFAAASR